MGMRVLHFVRLAQLKSPRLITKIEASQQSSIRHFIQAAKQSGLVETEIFERFDHFCVALGTAHGSQQL